MNKKLLCIVIAVMLSFMLSGCGSPLASLPEEPLKFDTYHFIYSESNDYGYRAFDYNGRTYIHFAELKGRIAKNAVGNCLGFIVQDGEEHDDEYVVRLKAFENDDILMIYFPHGMMDPPYFCRAIDTKGQPLELPSYIRSDSIADYWRQ